MSAPGSAVAKVTASFSPFFSPSELKCEQDIVFPAGSWEGNEEDDAMTFENVARGVSSPGEQGAAAIDYDLKENYDPLFQSRASPMKALPDNIISVPTTPFIFGGHSNTSIVTGSGPAGRFSRKKNEANKGKI